MAAQPFLGVFIGLDVSLSKTAVCVVDHDGAVLWQGWNSSRADWKIMTAARIVVVATTTRHSAAFGGVNAATIDAPMNG